MYLVSKLALRELQSIHASSESVSWGPSHAQTWPTHTFPRQSWPAAGLLHLRAHIASPSSIQTRKLLYGEATGLHRACGCIVWGCAEVGAGAVVGKRETM